MAQLGEGAAHLDVLEQPRPLESSDPRGETLRDAEVLSLPGHLVAETDEAARTRPHGAFAGPTYVSPISTACQKNFIIVISNGPFQDNSSDTSTAMSQLGSAGGNTTIINPPDTSSNNNAGDEWSRPRGALMTVPSSHWTRGLRPVLSRSM